jgi:hypothetical protein
MTVAEAVEQIFLAVEAMRPTAASPVTPAEIRNFLPLAINKAAVIEYRLQRQEAKQDGFSLNAPTDFVATYYSEVKKDENRGLWYADLPSRVGRLPHSFGVNDVFPRKGSLVSDFFKTESRQAALSLPQDARDLVTIYWWETIGSNDRVYFNNIPSVVKDVGIIAMLDIDELDDDDIIPVPQSVIFDAIQASVQYFGMARNQNEPTNDGK